MRGFPPYFQPGDTTDGKVVVEIKIVAGRGKFRKVFIGRFFLILRVGVDGR